MANLLLFVLPLDSNITRSVFVGLSLASLVGGVINALGQMAIDYLVARLGAGKTKLSTDEEWAKNLLGTLVGALSTRAQNWIDPRYPIATSLTLSGPGGAEIKIAITGGSSDAANNPTKVTVSMSKAFSEHARSATDAKATLEASYTGTRAAMRARRVGRRKGSSAVEAEPWGQAGKRSSRPKAAKEKRPR